MKQKWIKTVACVISSVLLIGCRTDGEVNTEYKNQATEQSGVISVDNVRKVMIDGKLYVDTGETNNNMPRCGVMDGQITSSVDPDENPSQDGQSNFGADWYYQFGSRNNRIEVSMDGNWYIFAYNENNFEGVAMEVVQNTNTSATVEITNETDKTVIFGEEYKLEQFNEETQEWQSVEYKKDPVFIEIAIVANKGETTIWNVDWSDLYGKLAKGQYRLVKEIMDSWDSGDSTKYVLSAEFIVET